MIPIRYCVSEHFVRRNNPVISTFLNRCLNPCSSTVQVSRGKKTKSNNSQDTNSSTLFKPVPIKPTPDDINVGAELTNTLRKGDLMKILNKFKQKPEIKKLCHENGLDDHLRQEAFNNFLKYCIDADSLPVDLHIVISDILQGSGNITDIFPYFIRHAKQIFPHINCLDDLRKISDLRSPANWYPEARSKTRKIVFHSGPTNSGKTYHALERFMSAKTGIYCGPLKLLASEVFNKCNAAGTSCDLITGEEKKYVHGKDNPAQHVSCTVEMANLHNNYEVAVIDEIQLIRDYNRGWAWSRSLLGIPADEVHLCGEEGAIDLIKSICFTVGEDVEVRRYKRLTELEVESNALGDLSNIKPGDCIVCFSKNDIYTVTRGVEKLGWEVAVIYGSLPPTTKLAQAAKFNDPTHPCNVLVATDAVGMGLNLHIRRIIFYSLIKPVVNEKGEKEMNTISVSSALQIAGRAGRYGTQHDKGYVTTFKPEDLPTLRKLLSSSPEPITQAGLQPTADQIELYAYHLPNSTLSNLMDIFLSLSTVDDSLYFICNMVEFKFLADMIQHVPLPLRARYVFCCAPINRKFPIVCTMFLKFARQYSRNDAITYSWLCQNIGWPFEMPKNILDLVHLEAVFDVLDLYLWLSYRFPDLFPDCNMVKFIQSELDSLIQSGISQTSRLLKNTETGISSGQASIQNEDDFELQTKKRKFIKSMQTRSDGKGKLTDRLLAEGLITQEMLQELQREWIEKRGNPNDDGHPDHKN